ncbi:tail completion or Neck1 protein [Dinoroseobacter phage vB_DshS-R5C]|uniref:Virion structural protein n=1 Tax=Dinoroseobacter phage vB_DshS-R5C TaxID=1965368 RepID=A0A1V0DY73_9CAUD|nr:tail completion or Neck1 protein [Dinoroseobacter phage vB_DshS-R5C]ARB06112.1 virion structural protein [Dinoroseobacter phage vB_DshS-R5C]
MPRGLSAREFAIDLKRFGKVTEEQATLIFQKIAIDLDTRVVLGTPVDSGRARGNWFPSVGSPSAQVDMNASDKSGSAATAAATSTVSGAKIGDVLWLTNNLPYILPLENGWSGQAPEGMVDLNLNAIAAQYGGSIQR